MRRRGLMPVLACLLLVGCQVATAAPRATPTSVPEMLALQANGSQPAAQSQPAATTDGGISGQSSDAEGIEPTSVPQDAEAPPTAVPADAPTGVPVATATPADVASAAPAAFVSPCDQPPPAPLPGPNSADRAGFFRSFRLPLPAVPLYNPHVPKRVGLQAGHWLTDQVPPELSGLQDGTSGGGKAEWQVNLDLAQRAAGMLEADGIRVDVLPATVPPGYQANLFLAIHADGDASGALHGFKVAAPGFSAIPGVDDALVQTINDVYGEVTGLPRDDAHISLRMTYYYAFNARRYCHSVAPGVPQAIIETAYLTSALDRRLLLGDPDVIAHGIAASVEQFLNEEDQLPAA